MKYLKTFKHNNYQLLDAVKDKNLDTIKELLKNPNIDVNYRNIFGVTALMLASCYDLGVVKELLKQPNININIQNNDGDTALHLASWNHKLNIVKELLKNPNIDINIQDRNGQTAIFKAAIKASNLVNVWKINDSIYLKTIKELLKHPIDINIQDKNDKYFYDYLTNDQLQDNEILMIKNIKKYNI